MSGDNYISDYKLDEIRKEYGEKIVLFSKVEQQVKAWYKNFGFIYPLSSINNYRDSWFHYRKIWGERSFYEITCQTATLDEHLQRAEKDAIVSLFQIISQNLEFWYLFGIKEIPEEYRKNIEQRVLSIYDYRTPEEEKNNLWVSRIYDEHNPNEQEMSFALIYAAKTYIFSSLNTQKQIQQLLHLIKNITLNIRFGAADVHRIEYPGEYLNLSKDSYKEVEDFFNKEENRGLFFLFCVTDVVKANVENYKIEQKKKDDMKKK